MNTEKVFAKMLKAHSKGECVALVTNYENAREVAKLIMSMPNAYIENFQLSSAEWDGYCDPWLLSYGEEGDIWCQKAVLDNGHIAKGDGLYFIDEAYADIEEVKRYDGNMLITLFDNGEMICEKALDKESAYVDDALYFVEYSAKEFTLPLHAKVVPFKIESQIFNNVF